MINSTSLYILMFIFLAVTAFVLMMWRKGSVQLIHKIYFCVAGVTLIWTLALIIFYFLPQDSVTVKYIIDSATNVGVFLPVLGLIISMTFSLEWERLPKKALLLLIVPTLTFFMVWTNPLHHCYYAHFDTDVSGIVFGWYFYVHCAYSYACVLLSVYYALRFSLRNKSSLYSVQAILLTVGILIPVCFNILATTGVVKSTIVGSLYSYTLGTVLFHGVAIFYFHLLDIKPVAAQSVLDRISDCYLVVSAGGIVVSFNNAFEQVFGTEYGIRENKALEKCADPRRLDNKTGLYTLITALQTCRDTHSAISYEQSAMLHTDAGAELHYYMVDITPILSEHRSLGHVVFFKDVTKLKESMERLQSSQARLMEQERLAFLGQMVGGIAHNLKTPIMSISGSVSSIDNLIDESTDSIGDADVTEDDFREIYSEMRDWTARIREACAYMSDIITTVKGQAADMEADSETVFSMDEVIKRCSMLLRHELVGNRCELSTENKYGGEVCLHGDINAMVQVMNNLIGNAIDAVKPKGGGHICVLTEHIGGDLIIRVRDDGCGISADIREKLFKHMVTNKGAQGSGLGLFISNTIIRARFNGSMWFEDVPGGGTVFGITIPEDGQTANETGEL